jgi:hypothetical protein
MASSFLVTITPQLLESNQVKAATLLPGSVDQAGQQHIKANDQSQYGAFAA